MSKQRTSKRRKKQQRLVSDQSSLKTAIIAAVVGAVAGAVVAVLLPWFLDWLQRPELRGKLVDIGYTPKEDIQVIRDWQGDSKRYTGVSYRAVVQLQALNKSYSVENVRVFIALKTGETKEGMLFGSSGPGPNSNGIPIQYLKFLEKDKVCFCYVNFLLEGEQKENITDMAFTRIELRLYDHKGTYKKVDLFPSDIPGF
ncbi:MAG: hypothetical protein ACFFCW_01030 [Candidatus Hodarchaeota archaeon]